MLFVLFSFGNSPHPETDSFRHSDCRRTSAQPIYKIPRASFHITAGSSHIKCIETPASSGLTVTTFFCSECGTTIYRAGPLAQVETEENIHLRAGILNDAELVNSERMKPQVEVWVERRATWQEQVEGATQVTGK